METIQLFSNEFAIIEADSQLKFIQVTWQQHTSHADLREVLIKASELARAQGLNKWLFDMRKLNFTTTADQHWSASDLFPSFDLQHQHRLACVATPQNVELMTGTRIKSILEDNSELNEKIELEIFISMESALQWLFDNEEAETPL